MSTFVPSEYLRGSLAQTIGLLTSVMQKLREDHANSLADSQELVSIIMEHQSKRVHAYHDQMAKLDAFIRSLHHHHQMMDQPPITPDMFVPPSSYVAPHTGRNNAYYPPPRPFEPIKNEPPTITADDFPPLPTKTVKPEPKVEPKEPKVEPKEPKPEPKVEPKVELKVEPKEPKVEVKPELTNILPFYKERLPVNMIMPIKVVINADYLDKFRVNPDKFILYITKKYTTPNSQKPVELKLFVFTTNNAGYSHSDVTYNSDFDTDDWDEFVSKSYESVKKSDDKWKHQCFCVVGVPSNTDMIREIRHSKGYYDLLVHQKSDLPQLLKDWSVEYSLDDGNSKNSMVSLRQFAGEKNFITF